MMGRALEVAVADLKEDGGRGYGEVEDEGGLDPDTGQGVASSHWHQGAAAAEVEVDEETGKLTVVRLHVPVYAGRAVNRPAAELQNEGSMIMGLGSTLFEANEFAEGQVTNANLSDYNVPAMDDMPASLTHELVEREGAEVQGLGETALPPVPPAVGNALYSTGIDVTELPISAEAILDAVDARDEREGGRTAAGLVSANGSGSNARVGERVSVPDAAPDGDGVSSRARALIVSTPSLLFFGTIGAGLLALLLYRLLRRAGENGRRDVASVLQRSRSG